MTLRLKGYLRSNPGGAAVSGVTVSLLDTNTGLAPSTTSFTNLSGTTSVTDATGKWEFTMDLNPVGPLRVEADLGSGNKRHRRSDELFEYDGYFVNQLPETFQAFKSGVMYGVANEFSTSASATRVLTISPGSAIIKGYYFGWDSGTKAITGAANGSGSNRVDFLVLRQWYNGVNAGKQDIVLVQGTTADPVVTTTESDLTKFIQGANIWDLPIYRCTLASAGTVYTAANMVTSNDYPYAAPRIERITNTVSFGADVNANGDVRCQRLLADGSCTFGNTGADVVTLYGHIEVAGTNPSVSTAANNTFAAGAQSISFGTDTSFEVTGISKAVPASGSAFDITFNQARSTSNYTVTVTPRSSGAAALGWYVSSKSASGFSLLTTTAAPAAVTIALGVQVI